MSGGASTSGANTETTHAHRVRVLAPRLNWLALVEPYYELAQYEVVSGRPNRGLPCWLTPGTADPSDQCALLWPELGRHTHAALREADGLSRVISKEIPERVEVELRLISLLRELVNIAGVFRDWRKGGSYGDLEQWEERQWDEWAGKSNRTLESLQKVAEWLDQLPAWSLLQSADSFPWVLSIPQRSAEQGKKLADVFARLAGEAGVRCLVLHAEEEYRDRLENLSEAEVEGAAHVSEVWTYRRVKWQELEFRRCVYFGEESTVEAFLEAARQAAGLWMGVDDANRWVARVFDEMEDVQFAGHTWLMSSHRDRGRYRHASTGSLPGWFPLGVSNVVKESATEARWLVRKAREQTDNRPCACIPMCDESAESSNRASQESAVGQVNQSAPEGAGEGDGHGGDRADKEDDSHVQLRERFSFAPGQASFDKQDLNLPSGLPVEVLKKLVDSFGITVGHEELHDGSRASEASEELRTAVASIRKRLKDREIPCEIISKRSEGYSIRPLT